MRPSLLLLAGLAMACTNLALPGGGSSGSSSSSSGGGGGGGSSSGGVPPRPAACLYVCNTQADCGSPGVPLQEAQNFRCTSGACFYSGCSADSECNPPGVDAGVHCLDPVDGVRSCAAACATKADCDARGTEGAGLFGWTCASGHCLPAGCNVDADCPVNGDRPDAGSVCRIQRSARANQKQCVPACASPADCGGAATDHYDCTGGACVFMGCQSDAECTQEGSTPVVCR